MLYTDKTKSALQLCYEAHKNQWDKSGLPYVFHPFHLAEQMKDENSTIVALLHDVIEDSHYTMEDLRNYGFDEDVFVALQLLTHEKQMPYEEYILTIKTNPLATTVKLADLRHNSDISRLDSITEEDLQRIAKYKRAIQVLTNP